MCQGVNPVLRRWGGRTGKSPRNRVQGRRRGSQGAPEAVRGQCLTRVIQPHRGRSEGGGGGEMLTLSQLPWVPPAFEKVTGQMRVQGCEFAQGDEECPAYCPSSRPLGTQPRESHSVFLPSMAASSIVCNVGNIRNPAFDASRINWPHGVHTTELCGIKDDKIVQC